MLEVRDREVARWIPCRIAQHAQRVVPVREVRATATDIDRGLGGGLTVVVVVGMRLVAAVIEGCIRQARLITHPNLDAVQLAGMVTFSFFAKYFPLAVVTIVEITCTYNFPWVIQLSVHFCPWPYYMRLTYSSSVVPTGSREQETSGNWKKCFLLSTMVSFFFFFFNFHWKFHFGHL